MHWFFYAFIAPFLWSLVNIADQYLVAKYSGKEKSPGALVLFSSFIGVFVALLVGVFASHVWDISTLDKVLLMLSGVFTILWVILYLLALRIEDVSSVVPWFVTVPVFGYFLGYVFLGEDLTLLQKVGSFVILIGTLILSFDFSKKGESHFKWRMALYMLPACLLLAIMGIVFKYVTVAGDFWISTFWVHAGLGLSGVFIYIFSKNYRQSFKEMMQMGGVKIFTLNTVSEVVSVLGNLASSYATLLAPVALVLIIGNFQPAILLVLTLISTKFFPDIIKENLNRRILLPKIISIIIIVIGSVFLFQ